MNKTLKIVLIVLGATFVSCSILVGGLVYFVLKSPAFEEFTEVLEEIGNMTDYEYAESDEAVFGPDEWAGQCTEWDDRENLTDVHGLSERYETVYLYDDTRELLFRDRDFEALEARLRDEFDAADTYLKKYRYSRHIGYIGGFYCRDDGESNIQVLNDWVDAKPDSHWARLIRGQFFISYAWYFRGTGFSNRVTREGWEGFHEYMGRAEEDLKLAFELETKDPEAAVTLVRLTGATSQSRRIMKRYFDAAIAINPYHYDAWEDYVFYQLPKWGGSAETVLPLIRECEKAIQPGHEFPLLALVARMGYEQLHLADEISETKWSKVRRTQKWANAIIFQLEATPDDVRLLSQTAYYFAYTPYSAKAMEYFERVGDRYPAGGMWPDLYGYNETRSIEIAETAERLFVRNPEDAKELLDKAIAIAPYADFVNYVYARGQLEWGD
ncbi:MAG: DUF4034 domain-containing protein [Candidatus Hydrogenedentota bacterium]